MAEVPDMPSREAFVGVGGGYRAAADTAGHRAVKSNAPVEGQLQPTSFALKFTKGRSRAIPSTTSLFIGSAWQLVEYRKWVGKLEDTLRDRPQQTRTDGMNFSPGCQRTSAAPIYVGHHQAIGRRPSFCRLTDHLV
jgi:hypothetical protein